MVKRAGRTVLCLGVLSLEGNSAWGNMRGDLSCAWMFSRWKGARHGETCSIKLLVGEKDAGIVAFWIR